MRIAVPALFMRPALALAAALLPAAAAAQGVPPWAQPAAATAALPPRPLALAPPPDETSAVKQRANAWTIGLAAGQLEGAPLRFATELARVLDDGDNMRVLPIVTRGVFDNVSDLLHLHGVDAAIVYGDVLEHFRKERKLADLDRRINYLMPLFPSELHVFVRPEIRKLEDLAGKPVNFNTPGTAAAYSGPIIFDRLGIKVDARFVPHPVAMDEMLGGDKYAAVVFVSSKPLDPFVKRKWPEGFKFLPVPLTQKLEDYYIPAELAAADYPGLIAAGQTVQTVAVPSVLAVYNWQPDRERYRRMTRFVDYLFKRFSKLQKDPGYHPKWAELNLAATVPGWVRYAPMQARLAALVEPVAASDKRTELSQQLERLLPGDAAGQERLMRELLDWRRSQRRP